MTPQMGVVTDADLAAAVAAHNALTIAHGTVDDIADQTDIENHRLDADAHHSEEIAEGRVRSGGNSYLVLPGVSAPLNVGTAQLSLNRVYYYPIKVKTPITVANLVLEVTTAAGAGNKAQIGIYSADINWQPVALQLASVEVAIDAIALVSSAYAVTLQPGRYLVAYTGQASAAFRYVEGTAPFTPTYWLLGAAPLIWAYYVGRAYAALPAVGVVWDTFVNAATPFRFNIFLDVLTP